MPSHLENAAFVVVVLGLLMAAPGAAVAASDPAAAPHQAATQWQIDMPPQSVDEAIYQLGVVTDVQIFADGQVVAGRRARSISGAYTAEDALKTVLAGTGLVVRATGMGSLLVTEALSGPKSEELRRHYSTELQRRVVKSLCAAADPGIGNYRLALRMWITEQGRPERVDLLSSTGDRDRDLRIRDVLLGISASKPPEGLPQPVIMVILPRSSQDSGDCNPHQAVPAGLDGRKP
jgi:hypothetical protein